MASVYQLGFLVAILLTLCQAENQGRVDCRLYPYAPKCRGIMTRKNFHGGEYPIDPAGFPDAGMWGAAGGPVGSRVVQGGLAARAYTPETDSADDADLWGGAAGKPDFSDDAEPWGAAAGKPPFSDDKWWGAGAGKQDFMDKWWGAGTGKQDFMDKWWEAGAGKPPFSDDKWWGGATGKPDVSDDGGWGAAGEPIGRRVVKGGIRPRATDKFL